MAYISCMHPKERLREALGWSEYLLAGKVFFFFCFGAESGSAYKSGFFRSSKQLRRNACSENAWHHMRLLDKDVVASLSCKQKKRGWWNAFDLQKKKKKMKCQPRRCQ